ncbi:hypothetical protein [Kitasatospora sp. NPDC094011]|uniref:hypothetical protein n=1 Tax=Kitasatospora sp. NPDC094011 TaxID=3364090 RepID=UPI00380F4800
MAGEHDELGEASRGVSNRIEGSTLHGPALQAGTMYVSFGGDSYGGDAAPAPPPPAPPPLAPPPAPAPGFIGRDRELRDLLDALTPRAEQPDTDDPTTTTDTATDTATAAVLVLGMGGVGKTTLALTAARKALASGLVDGVLFLDLAGYDDTAFPDYG